jgi:hypothetical protein
MTQEQKPKKKKLSLMSVLGDPGKAVAELMEDPDIIAKIPEVLAKCPPAAMQVLACSIAPYLPPTKIEVDEVTRATADILRPILQEHIVKTINAIPKEATTGTGNVDELSDLIKGQVSTMVVDGLSEVRKQLVHLATSIKAIQDGLPAQIQAQVSTIFKAAELEAFQRQVEARNKS